jgi:anaerobic selenocysteine-containing dehydrogenase
MPAGALIVHAAGVGYAGSMQVKTSCNRDCPDACGIVATVEDGRVKDLRGDPDHPVTRGFLCYRTSRFLERQYDPQRLTTPMLQRKDGYEPVSWDAALDLVAEKMLRIREESGPAAILNYRSGGSLGMLKRLTDYFFERFGPVTIKSGSVCSGAGNAGQERDFGEANSNDLHDLLNSNTIILWGKNPFVSNVHLLPVLREAKDRGARLVLVDPVHHRGAELCESYVQPRPGHDVALALGLIRQLYDTRRTDPDVSSYCDGVDDLRALAFSRTVAEWAAQADLSFATLEELARVYSKGPSAILVGWGLQRRANGFAIVRALDALCAVSGNLGVSGGGVSFNFKRSGAFDLSFIGGLGVAPRAIPEPLLGPGILEASDPPVRMVWISNGNPVTMLPESETVAHALRTREFTVVVDSFMTDSAREAHLVLPTTTMLEDDDLVGAYGNHYLGNVSPVVPPPEGVRTDYEIVQALAPRVGLGDEFAAPVAQWKRRLLQPLAKSGVSVETLAAGSVRNPLAPEIAFAERKFGTPSGRADLTGEIGPDPVLPTEERPLLLMALATAKAQCSQWPSRLQQGPVVATVHPESAAGFRDGEVVLVESEVGSMRVELNFDERQRTDVLLVPKGGWRSRGRCPNSLIRARTTDVGGGAMYYETPVRLVAVKDLHRA